MAIYYLNTKAIGRSTGGSATRAAAYRAGERIRDQRTNTVYNYSRRQDVMHKEIVLPSRFDGADVQWARDRARLWNAAEHAEPRSNSRVAREYQVALPAELGPAERLGLTRQFARELAERYNVAVDFAIHAPRRDNDSRNYHAHLLTTTREITLVGLGAKAGLDMHSDVRRARGLVPGIKELIAIREHWATVTNEALREAGIDARIDHRSLAAQGIDREPVPYLPRAIYKLERSGKLTEAGERIRERYRARVQARLERAAQRTTSEQDAGRVERDTIDPKNMEEIRRQAREAWLQLRQQQTERASGEARHKGHARGRDDDFSM
jgi:ATP-dependent exoDNAse (exonuclease V) alpha subunit